LIALPASICGIASFVGRPPWERSIRVLNVGKPARRHPDDRKHSDGGCRGGG
jgi:hypothetical protein